MHRESNPFPALWPFLAIFVKGLGLVSTLAACAGGLGHRLHLQYPLLVKEPLFTVSPSMND